MTYSDQFYNVIRNGAQRSAAVVVPLVLNTLSQRRPRTVVDVGCGEGWWAAEFAARGCTAVGMDGDYVRSKAPNVTFRSCDLEQPLDRAERFDLAIALEVAEHLRPARAESFIADLCALAPVVLFSAAIPGQGGANHINEQPPTYWADIFERNGYRVTGALRWLIWENDDVENWYRQNLLLAVAAGGDLRFDDALFSAPGTKPLHVVHPVLFDAMRSR